MGSIKYHKQNTNYDFDILENEGVFENPNDLDRLVNQNLYIPSDDSLLSESPSIALRFPVEKVPETESHDGYVMLHGHAALVKQNFRNLMLTSPGEKTMDPNFGVGLRKYLFEQSEVNLINNVRARIISQAGEYMPFITLRRIDIKEGGTPGVQDNELRFFISYVVTSLGFEDEFSFPSSIDDRDQIKNIRGIF
jgi:hypothetical protein